MKQRILSWVPDPVLAVLGRSRSRVRPTTADLERVQRDRIDRELGHPQEVAQGPFTGMRIERWFFGRWLRQILGTYEYEVWPAVERLCELDPRLIVNIGAANGYYAVGLARRLPEARVIAYEGDFALRRVLGRTATSNSVKDRVDIRGLCTPSELQAVLGTGQRSAVICDCDGCEDPLLDPDMVTALRAAIILVELHDHLAPGVGERIRKRFKSTHDIRENTIGERQPDHLPSGWPLGIDDGLFAMREYRKVSDAQVWLMTPRALVEAGSPDAKPEAE